MDALALGAEEGRGLTPICFGELYVSVDPEISEWGEPTIFSRIVSLREYIVRKADPGN